ncbi:MAG: non-canonical purine NTP pyrophosphatase, RdgB/HAM1 family [Verrucomicrobia bacterium 13_2_20CM_55_10]|nr:MAG: non-canonical purine NTP pyrophosphatase, RdgB/HAM1 family [Verrucomicrobia bacterium 13_2_20CM_55_10]OLB17883.1 MAG: non-canonical purine NTP pyrophosphatase, RdgB/HAM1 family [Verrucomicrobia bacterium 13_2_20CM_2_54_15_9cls]PYI62792.1 MAG: non-canonical purine NTP pyrophosphatase, RdgB/HAM1 family [Verrucomicrobiota bacterium]
MIRLLVATRNAHKTREIQHILGSGFSVRDLRAYPQISEIIETGTSFEENAKLKALGVSTKLPGLVIADDSGLEVDALGGAPGIHSARYAGANATDTEKIDKLLEELARVRAKNDSRRARFHCLLALARNGEVLGVFEGTVEGQITQQPRGSHGFGYDPIFVPKGFERTFGELGPAEKNQLSHRARALEKLRTFLVPRSGQ